MFESLKGSMGSKLYPIIPVISLYALLYLFCFAVNLVDIPKVRLIEHAVCQRYYHSHPLAEVGAEYNVPERRCKLVPIQAEVALITGWRMSLDAIPSVLTVTFYGELADQRGRKPALLLVCFGELLALIWSVLVCYLERWLPARLVWTSSIFLLVGGGQRMFAALILTMIADVTQYSQRTRLFYFLGLIDSISALTAPPVEAWTMARSMWLPFALALALYLVMGLLMCTVQETGESCTSTSASPKSQDSVEPLLPTTPEDTEPLLSTTPETTSEEQGLQRPEVDEVINSHNPWKETFKLLMTANLSIVLFCFFAKRIGFTSNIFFPQYASERFHLMLQKTPWFRWIESFGSSLVLGLALPLITAQLQRQRVPPRRIDLTVIYFSLSVLTAGYFSAWRASNPTVFGAAIFLCGLGEGATPALQGLASSFVEPAQIARLFTTVTLLDTTGRLISGPLLAKLHSVARNSDQEPNGAMFLVSSCVFGFTMLMACFIKLH